MSQSGEQRPAPVIDQPQPGLWRARFLAMASPCEVFVECAVLSSAAAEALLLSAANEAWRIEAKFSRYRNDNIVHAINSSAGKSLTVDDETACLLDYAAQCFALSDGMFDITSGRLRTVWCFDGREAHIEARALQQAMAVVGWQRLRWQNPVLTLVPGAEIDFGGIGKEYAVDKTVQLLRTHAPEGSAILVNYGGDLACAGRRAEQQPWVIGVASIGAHSPLAKAGSPIYLFEGALATSGDTHRFAYYQGVKVSHVLNPKTGYPVSAAPQSVTVAAATCTLAGMLASFAMLAGAASEEFLQSQEVRFWLQRAAQKEEVYTAGAQERKG